MTKTPRETVVKARELASANDWQGVRSLLAREDGSRPKGIPLFLLARAEYELGNAAAAEPLVAEFRQQSPDHVGAHLLTARVKLATGDLDAAEAAARAGADLSPNDKPYRKVLDRIATARERTYDVEADLATIDAAFPAARTEGATPEVVAAATRVRRIEPNRHWANRLTQAKIAYFHHAPDVEAALRNYDPHQVDIAVQYGYLIWPRRIQEHVRGRSVLDVGCGFGGFGMGFLVAGATSYVGIDPAMDLDSTKARNKRARVPADLGVTPRRIAEEIPAIRLIQGPAEKQSLAETFDTITMHNVTEHLRDLDAVLAGLAGLCHADTRLVLHHHSFYSWNGHHLAPVKPSQLDESDEKQQLVYDWRHINAVPDLPDTHPIKQTLNRIRLDELRSSIEVHFDVDQWDEFPSDEEANARLTPEIVERVRTTIPDITERELTVNTVLIVARLKS